MFVLCQRLALAPECAYLLHMRLPAGDWITCVCLGGCGNWLFQVSWGDGVRSVATRVSVNVLPPVGHFISWTGWETDAHCSSALACSAMRARCCVNKVFPGQRRVEWGHDPAAPVSSSKIRRISHLKCVDVKQLTSKQTKTLFASGILHCAFWLKNNYISALQIQHLKNIFTHFFHNNDSVVTPDVCSVHSWLV